MKHTGLPISSLEIFHGLTEQKLNKIDQLFDLKQYKKHTVLFKPGDSRKVYIVKSGRVELYRITEEGRKFIVDVLKKGGIFGDFDLKFPTEIYAETIEETVIFSTSTDKFIDLLKDPALSVKLFKFIFNKLILIEKKMTSLATDNVFRKFLKLIVYLGKNDELLSIEHSMTDRYTHEQLSQMLGVSRQTITTLINDLENKGFLQRKKKRFIYDKDKLQKLIA
ncbi:MAG: hypothetical protein UR15_C0008G0014 [Parcubacteria group bacterium GW2011_GWA2_31_28]|nr:MAG: hypothetical protein UR15_C0008G0014 [Parcubacteria group bacterium GW2011_GWA2_31_28]